jgi:hypothetical protein
MSSRRFVALACILATLISISGCVSTDSEVARENNRQAERSGSPFRLKYKENFFGGGGTFTTYMIDLPKGPTKADPKLKADIIKAIDDYEIVMGRSVRPIAEVRLLPDGREVWILDSQKERSVAYVVTLHGTSQVDKDFDIGMPNWFSKTANQPPEPTRSARGPS